MGKGAEEGELWGVTAITNAPAITPPIVFAAVRELNVSIDRSVYIYESAQGKESNRSRQQPNLFANRDSPATLDDLIGHVSTSAAQSVITPPPITRMPVAASNSLSLFSTPVPGGFRSVGSDLVPWEAGWIGHPTMRREFLFC